MRRKIIFFYVFLPLLYVEIVVSEIGRAYRNLCINSKFRETYKFCKRKWEI